MNNETLTQTEVQTNNEPEKKGRQIITPEMWAEVKKSYIENQLGPKKLAEMYGIKISTIDKMATRRGWYKEREIYKIQRSAGVEEPINDVPEDGVRSLTRAGKAGCIESMIEIARGLLIKLEARVRTISSNDDKEISRVTESMVRLYGVLEPLLGITKGEGNRDKVKPNQVQAEILESGMEAIDRLKAGKKIVKKDT